MYSWRSVDVKCLKAYEKDYKKVKVTTLAKTEKKKTTSNS